MLLDHVFVAVSPGAPEAERLVQAGFAEGPPNTHPGQGTACRRFFFENAYLELIWLADRDEAASPSIARTGLDRRSTGDGGASRVGVCLRLPPGGEPPVETWDYAPPYLPAGMSIPVAASASRLDEPLLFFLPARAPASAPAHPNGARTVTGVRLTVADAGPASPALTWLSGTGTVAVDRGLTERVDLLLDDGAQGRSLELATPTPVGIRW